MKIKDFIRLFDNLGYDDDTELDIGAFDSNGDWFEFEFEVEDNDRKTNPDINTIGLTLEVSKSYMDSEMNNLYDRDFIIENIVSAVDDVLRDTL